MIGATTKPRPASRSATAVSNARIRPSNAVSRVSPSQGFWSRSSTVTKRRVPWGVNRDPVVAPKADRGVVDRLDVEAPTVSQRADQRPGLELLRQGLHSGRVE